MRKFILIIVLLICSEETSFIFPQSEVVTIRENLIAQFSKVEDFSVDVQLSLEMTAIRMPRKKIKVYFKQPDKVKIETNGFAMVPQYGLPLAPETILNTVSDMILVTNPPSNEGYVRLRGELQIMDENRHIWNFSRKQRRSLSIDILVDTQRWLITEYDVFRGEDKIIHVQTQFTEPVSGIFLPEETMITIQIPTDLMDELPDMPFEEEPTSQDGNVIMSFKNYQLNQGLDSSFFEEEAE
ncbi:MAG: hypothetical protein HQ510_09355 [Candidatus Marinimicrobia bacterium]|nr:hypothetical protein [Candidatus Neomarinimicrobiota bacterium]